MFFSLFLRFFALRLALQEKAFSKIYMGGKIINVLYRLRNYFSESLYEISKPKGIVLINNVQGNKIFVNTEDRTIVPHLLLDRVWEKYKTELFKQVITQGMTVVDIGANIGCYSLIAAKLVGKNGIVYAFEPEPRNYELLCKNIRINGFSNVIPIKKAASYKSGMSKLYYEKERIVNPSLLKENVLAASGHNILEKGGFIEEETISLDEFFRKVVGNSKIDVIKVDTEGAEGLMVDGAERILRSNNLKIFCEFWPEHLGFLGLTH